MIKYFNSDKIIDSGYIFEHYPNMGYLITNIDENAPHNPFVFGTLRAICDKDDMDTLISLSNKLMHQEPLVFVDIDALIDCMQIHEQKELTEDEKKLYE